MQLQTFPVPVWLVVMENDDPNASIAAIEHWLGESRKTCNEMTVLLQIKRGLTDSIKVDFWWQLMRKEAHQRLEEANGAGWIPCSEVTEDKMQFMLDWRNNKLKSIG